jgi:hypothetical protein
VNLLRVFLVGAVEQTMHPPDRSTNMGAPRIEAQVRRCTTCKIKQLKTTKGAQAKSDVMDLTCAPFFHLVPTIFLTLCHFPYFYSLL